jgi:hypothetical protein
MSDCDCECEETLWQHAVRVLKAAARRWSGLDWWQRRKARLRREAELAEIYGKPDGYWRERIAAMANPGDKIAVDPHVWACLNRHTPGEPAHTYRTVPVGFAKFTALDVGAVGGRCHVIQEAFLAPGSIMNLTAGWRETADMLHGRVLRMSQDIENEARQYLADQEKA